MVRFIMHFCFKIDAMSVSQQFCLKLNPCKMYLSALTFPSAYPTKNRYVYVEFSVFICIVAGITFKSHFDLSFIWLVAVVALLQCKHYIPTNRDSQHPQYISRRGTPLNCILALVIRARIKYTISKKYAS